MNVLYVSIKSYLDVEKVLASSRARVGQAFGGMAVGRGALSEAAMKQPVQAAAAAPPLGLCSLA